jgi:serine/threonine-protein kinase
MQPSEVQSRSVTIPESEVHSALERVIASASLRRSPQLQRFLRFVVEESLAGRGVRLKEYVLGVEIFGRPTSYDPRLDSLVRVEARRLRAALDEYYVGKGSSDPVIIDLPKGSYAPSFRQRDSQPAIPPETTAAVRPRGKRWWLVLSAAVAALALAGITYELIRLKGVPATRVSTIAVLPFENLTTEAENDLFCFGLMDQITNELAKTRQLRVVARTSAAVFKRGDDIATIARRLKVDAVLEGSVSRSGNRIRVIAQLINTANNIHLWSESYERPNADPLGVQDEVAQAIAAAMRQHLTPNTERLLQPVRYSQNAEANQFYWQGSYLRTPMGRTDWRKDLAKSAEYLERAVRKDDRFARAYAALADVYVSLGWERGGGPSTRDLMTRGRGAAEHALLLDNTLAEAHGALGAVQFFFDYDRVAAEKSFQRALELDPNNGKARMWYAYALVMQRRSDEAISQARQAKELDPLSFVATTHLAVVYYFSRHYDEALRLVSETLDVANTAPAHGLRGMILESQQKYSEAIAEYQAGLRLVPTHAYIKGMLGHAYAMSGRRDEAAQLLKDSPLEFGQGGLSDLKLAYIYVALGDRNRAFQHLERDYELRDPELPYINADPVFDPVRNDPRFAAILAKMGLSR